MVVGAGAGPGVGAADSPGIQGLSLHQPRLQQDRAEVRAVVAAPPGVMKAADKPVVFEEDNKAGVKADELGEQRRQIQGTITLIRFLGSGSLYSNSHVSLFLSAPGNINEPLKGIPLPPNPAQVPNPIQPHHAKVPAEPVHHRQSELTPGAVG